MGVDHMCPRYHQSLTFHPLLYFQFSAKDIGVEAALKKLFTPKESERHCPECPDVGGFETNKVIILPKTLILILDEFDEEGKLNNLVTEFPQNIDFKDYIHECEIDIIEKTKYTLSSFIAFGFGKYFICMKKKSKLIDDG